jgi:hypothetical protein
MPKIESTTRETLTDEIKNISIIAILTTENGGVENTEIELRDEEAKEDGLTVTVYNAETARKVAAILIAAADWLDIRSQELGMSLPVGAIKQ